MKFDRIFSIGVFPDEKMVDSDNLKVKIDELVKEYVQARPNVGVVVGFIQQFAKYTKGFGKFSENDLATPDSQTIFEIGSITKVFTGITLAKLELEGKVALDDSISKYLPSDVNLSSQLQAITLRHLATHTSGLPRMPKNWLDAVNDQNNPYPDFKTSDLYRTLEQTELNSFPGEKFAYSNLGGGLLGHLLTLKTGKSYEELIKETITKPLGLNDTTITLSKQQRLRLTQGHSLDGNVVSNWDFDVLASAGAFRSTVNDLLMFMQANLADQLDKNAGDLEKAIACSHSQQFQAEKFSLGLTWFIFSIPEGLNIYSHSGATGGYRSFIGFNKKHSSGVVIFSNYGDARANDFSMDAMGKKILTLASY